MAKEISELLFSKHMEKKSDDPAFEIDSFIERASLHGTVKILHEKNFHSLGNPAKEKAVELVKSTDGITSLIFNCHANASGKLFSLSISGKITAIPGEDEIFRNFYMENVYPRSLEHMRREAKRFLEDMEIGMKK